MDKKSLRISFRTKKKKVFSLEAIAIEFEQNAGQKVANQAEINHSSTNLSGLTSEIFYTATEGKVKYIFIPYVHLYIMTQKKINIYLYIYTIYI